MNKSNHNYSLFELPYEETVNFIEPIKVNTNIFLSDLTNISGGNDFYLVHQELLKANEKMLSLVPSLLDRIKDNGYKGIYTIASITYNSHENGYDFRFNPIDFVNNVFTFLGINKRIPFINLDSQYGISFFKEFVSMTTKDIIKENNSSFIKSVAYEINSNIDSIIKYYGIDLTPLMKKIVIPKDLLFYISSTHLFNYIRSGEEKYLIFPMEYYNNISDMKRYSYPHKLHFGMSKYWYDDFNRDFDSYVKDGTSIDVSKYALSNDEVFIGWDILKPGEIKESFKRVNALRRQGSSVDYDKYENLFKAKMNFYFNSPCIKHIRGTYGLLGYLGFAYNNEYLIFDKFYNSESTKSFLTHGEAIFALPSDRFSILCDKQSIIRAKEVDDRIKKFNHTSNLSFINRLEGVINLPNVSTSTLDEEINKQKRLTLIKTD